MTPVGHTLTGLAIGAAVVPAAWSRRKQAVALASFVLLANLPDLPLPGWGHDKYFLSHSLLVTTAAIALLGLLVRLAVPGSREWPRRLWPAGAAAWYSHLLLDTTYNHGKGLAIYWPASNGRLALPIPWLSVGDRHHFVSWHNARVFAIEAATYGSVLLVVLVCRWWFRPRKTTEPAE